VSQMLADEENAPGGPVSVRGINGPVQGGGVLSRRQGMLPVD